MEVVLGLEQITLRLDEELMDALREEAKRRGQPMAVLARIFIRDALVTYDATSEQILQNTEQVNRRVEVLQQGLSAVLHLVAEQMTLSKERKHDESEEGFSKRLNANYRERVFDAVAKGKRITIALETVEEKR